MGCVTHSFDRLVAFLKMGNVIKHSKMLLFRVVAMCVQLFGKVADSSNNVSVVQVHSRIFLASFMVSGRPNHVFESLGAMERELMEASNVMLHKFEGMIRALREHGIDAFRSHGADFQQVLLDYLVKFKTWKVPDEHKLLTRIKHALVALYQARAHVPDGDQLLQEFQAQIGRLQGKFREIGGDAAFEQFQQEVEARGLENMVAENAHLAPEALPRQLTNEQLAHELLLDDSFQLMDDGMGCNMGTNKIRETFHRAFWMSLEDDMKCAAPTYVRAVRVLSEIKDGILDAKGHAIASIIDLDELRKPERAWGHDEVCALVSSIYAVIRDVENSSRHGETAAMWANIEVSMRESPTPTALCMGLEFLLNRVNVMRIDAANARLRLIAPVVKDHGIEYERGKFADKIASGHLTTERTKVLFSFSFLLCLFFNLQV